MPKINQSFEVDQSIETVWSFFGDVPQLVDCMPGVELLEDLGDGSFKGKMKVKVGPITANFLGEATITESDDSRHVGAISAQGADRQGGSRASAKVRYSLTPVGSGTSVDIVADISLQGAMARFGRTGIIEEVSSRLTREFADCIGNKLSATTVEEAAQVQAKDVKGLRIFLQSLWAYLKRPFKRDA